MQQKIKVLMVNLLVFLAGVLIIELVFGNWFSDDRIKKLNTIRDKTIHFKVSDLYESPLEKATYIRDEYGLRGNFDDPSEVVIVTIGGSTTDQRYITEGETWQDLLQKEFETSGSKIVVANAGVDGQSTFGHIKNFDWWFPHIPNFKPKYALFYIGLNDFHKEEGSGYDALVGGSIQQLLWRKSALYTLGQTLYGIYKAEMKLNIGHRSVDFTKEEWVTEPLISSYDKVMEVRLREYGERLELLIQKAKSFGSIPILLTQPDRMKRLRGGKIEGVKNMPDYDSHPMNGLDHYYMLRKLDEITCTMAKKYNALCIDMAKDLRGKWGNSDFYDHQHTTPNGNKIIGRYLFKTLNEKIGTVLD